MDSAVGFVVGYAVESVELSVSLVSLVLRCSVFSENSFTLASLTANCAIIVSSLEKEKTHAVTLRVSSVHQIMIS